MQKYLLILLLTCCAGRSLSEHVSDCLCDNAEVTNYALDEETMNVLKTEMKLLSTSNELLKARLDLMTLRFEQQTESFNKQTESFNKQMESFNKLIEKLNANIDTRNAHNNDPLIDVRADYNNEQSNEKCSSLKKFPRNCVEATSSKNSEGIYSIQLDAIGDQPFLVACDEETQGGGWTVIQSRKDGSIDFFRDWQSYKIGFGNLNTEFFIGLDKLHALTTADGSQELLIVMSDFEGATKYAKYDSFAIGNEEEAYVLKLLGQYSGDAGDSLRHHAGRKFSTKDRDNDSDGGSCATHYKGAWWYAACHTSNLNGLYLKGNYEKDKYAQGVVWLAWHGYYYSIKDVKMMIRPKRTGNHEI